MEAHMPPPTGYPEDTPEDDFEQFPEDDCEQFDNGGHK
jgi:hypothetical protein